MKTRTQITTEQSNKVIFDLTTNTGSVFQPTWRKKFNTLPLKEQKNVLFILLPNIVNKFYFENLALIAAEIGDLILLKTLQSYNFPLSFSNENTEGVVHSPLSVAMEYHQQTIIDYLGELGINQT